MGQFQMGKTSCPFFEYVKYGCLLDDQIFVFGMPFSDQCAKPLGGKECAPMPGSPICSLLVYTGVLTLNQIYRFAISSVD